VPKPLLLIESLRPWQQTLFDKLKKDPDDRTIHWYYDHVGNVGKTSFAKLMCAKHGAMYICGKASDMKYGIVSFHEKNNHYPEVLILDIPRQSFGRTSYKGLEEIKNGIFFSTKYECGMHIFNPPHLVVFANEEPDYEMMSEDRWNVVEIQSTVGQEQALD